MEALVVVARHRNQYNDRSKLHGPARFRPFGSPPSSTGIANTFRTFQSEAGILPTPLKACSTPVTKQISSVCSPNHLSDEEDNHLKSTVKSSPVSIPISINSDQKRESSVNGDCCFSELWAGPTYSSSPPPSSLPIPKFSLRPKRTVSLELPKPPPADIDFHPIAKSAPSSPTREHFHPPSFSHCDDDDSATKTLRRILNLDLADY